MENQNKPTWEEFTDEDFKLIISGLDALPKVKRTHPMDFIFDAISGDKGPSMDGMIDRIKRSVEERRKDEEKDHELLVEQVKILQGKILLLKRALHELSALNQANKILNKDK